MREFLYEFKDLDLPNEVRVVASFVLVQWRTDKPETRVNLGGDLITATERADG